MAIYTRKNNYNTKFSLIFLKIKQCGEVRAYSEAGTSYPICAD